MYRPGRIRSDRWRDIALICRDEALTVPAIARAMRVDAGSIQSLISSMRRENLLHEVGTNARGVALKLTRHGRDELKKHESAGRVAGLLGIGERLVFVIDEGRPMPSEVFAELAADPCFRWAARIDGTVKWIVSFGSGDAVAADRAANTLGVGARAVVGRSDAFFDALGLAGYAEQLGAERRQGIGAPESAR